MYVGVLDHNRLQPGLILSPCKTQYQLCGLKKITRASIEIGVKSEISHFWVYYPFDVLVHLWLYKLNFLKFHLHTDNAVGRWITRVHLDRTQTERRALLMLNSSLPLALARGPKCITKAENKMKEMTWQGDPFIFGSITGGGRSACYQFAATFLWIVWSVKRTTKKASKKYWTTKKGPILASWKDAQCNLL